MKDLIAKLHAEFREAHDIVDVGAANEHPSQGPNWAMQCSALLEEIEALIPRDAE